MKLLSLTDSKGKPRTLNVEKIESLEDLADGSTEITTDSGARFNFPHTRKKLMKRIEHLKTHRV